MLWNDIELPESFFCNTQLAIHNGECSSILSQFPECCIDIVITSPPYANIRSYNGYSFPFESIAEQLFRVVKRGGIMVWVVGDSTIKGSETGNSFRQALYFKDIGFRLHDTMIYEKLNGMPLNHNRYEQKAEYMFVLSKGKPATFNPILEPCVGAGKINTGGARQETISRSEKNANYGGWGYRKPIKQMKIKSNIWRYYTGRGHSTADASIFKQHPAIFPEQLAQDHILSWSKENDIVLDPMCGSGTTLKMALLNNRKAVGIDISESYCELSTIRCLRSQSDMNKKENG